MIASSNFFSSTQTVAPVGNNTKNLILITVAQFQEENQKTLKAKYLQTKKTKNNKNKNKNKQKEKNKQALVAFS